jgi:hypothetical protein
MRFCAWGLMCQKAWRLMRSPRREGNRHQVLCAQGRHRQTPLAAHHASCLRHAPSESRRRPGRCADVTGAQFFCDHANLCARCAHEPQRPTREASSAWLGVQPLRGPAGQNAPIRLIGAGFEWWPEWRGQSSSRRPPCGLPMAVWPSRSIAVFSQRRALRSARSAWAFLPAARSAMHFAAQLWACVLAARCAAKMI